MATRDETTRVGTAERRGVQTGDQGRPTSETKQALMSHEFWLWAIALIALILAGALIDEGRPDAYGPGSVWTYITIVTGGYLLSRGLAKAMRREGVHHETRPFFTTTEFWVFAGVLIALLISGVVVAGGTDTLNASLFAACLVFAYFISRGLAKSGAPGPVSEGRRGAAITDRAKAAAEAFSGGEESSGPRPGSGSAATGVEPSGESRTSTERGVEGGGSDAGRL